MVGRTRELELALGDIEKRIEVNEKDTVVVQRRCLRATRDLPEGTTLTRDDIIPLRPAPSDAIFPYDTPRVIDRTRAVEVKEGDYLRWNHVA